MSKRKKKTSNNKKKVVKPSVNKEIVKKIQLNLFRPASEEVTLLQKYRNKLLTPLLKLADKCSKKLSSVMNNKSKTQQKKELIKRWNFLNRTFKLYFITPIIRTGKRLLGHWLVRDRSDIPDVPWNKNAFVLYDSVNEAMEVYFDEYLTDMNGPPKCSKSVWKSKREKYMLGKSKGPEAIFFLRDIILTIAQEDTAYRTFLDIVMLKIQENMNKEWNPEIPHKVPCYITRIDGFIPYYKAWFDEQGIKSTLGGDGAMFRNQGFRECTHSGFQGLFWAGKVPKDFKMEDGGRVVIGSAGDFLVVNPSGKFEVMNPERFGKVVKWLGQPGVITNFGGGSQMPKGQGGGVSVAKKG